MTRRAMLEASGLVEIRRPEPAKPVKRHPIG
jgi:hypothetical protein